MQGFTSGRLLSIEPVRKELLRGKDVLANWVHKDVPDGFFAPVDDAGVQAAYAQVMRWVEQHSQYTRAAKQVIAKSADPWLVAHAVKHDDIIVSYEVSSQTKVKLPDVAAQFQVETLPPYVMLRQVKVRFDLANQP